MTEPKSTELFFRHEYGKLVAVLSRHVGIQQIELIEDSVQSALMKAIESWPVQGEPENSSAWLYKVASNHLTSELRQRANREKILQRNSNELHEVSQVNSEYFYSSEIQDDLLRMLFICCDKTIPVESQQVLALKTLCGFDVREIAIRLFTSEANVYKRLTRARKRLSESHDGLKELTNEEYARRLPRVHKILYLIFTEGYLASNLEKAIREELCDEAIRLNNLLAANPIGQIPESFALMAVMYFHRARLASRQNAANGLLLLEEQDRSLWDQSQIQRGFRWLEKSASGDSFSRYHAEAAIAAEHCLAPTFEETNWQSIVESYRILEEISPSALHRLNRAVAVAEWQNPQAGLAVLNGFEPPGWLSGSYQWYVVLADLQLRSGNFHEAEKLFSAAITAAPTEALRKLMIRRRDKLKEN